MRVAPLSIRLALVAAVAFTAALSGQSTSNAVVQIIARDSTGAPVPAAEVTIARRLHEVAAHGMTDSTGRARLYVALKDSAELQVTMRKIGYARGDRFFDAGPHDSVVVTITVPPRRLSELSPVRVTAMSSLRYKSYHLDADDIEQARMPLFDAWDVVKRLRPDMLTSRGGCATGALNVWVNGKRIRLPLRPTGITAERARVGAPPGARFSYVPVSVLSEIAPEHIREIVYHDCFDTSLAMVGANDAIFVTLQPGVVYQENVGSYVLDAPSRFGER